MFQNPHAFASSTVRQKVAAHRGSLSIGAVVAAGIGVIAWMIWPHRWWRRPQTTDYRSASRGLAQCFSLLPVLQSVSLPATVQWCRWIPGSSGLLTSN